MSGLEELKKWVKENSTIIIIILLFIAVFYVNMKVNDVDYRLQQTIMNPPLKDKQYGYAYT